MIILFGTSLQVAHSLSSPHYYTRGHFLFFVSLSFSGYEDSLKSLQRRERSNDVSRGSHDISSVVGRRANLAAKRRQRFHSFSNGESVYTHEMILQREQPCCSGSEKRRKAEHRRTHSEAENNITETVIHEHPATEISLASSLPNTSSLHGTLILINNRC